MLKKASARRESGDALIEVLFAITVFSLAVVAAFSLINQGTAASLRSLQITTVRQQIDSQAEALRFMSSAYISAYYPGYEPNLADGVTSPAEEFYKVIARVKATDAESASTFAGGAVTCPNPPSGSFIINTQQVRLADGPFTLADSYAQVLYAPSSGDITASQGIWIEAVRSGVSASDPNQANVSYTDFHIRACWPAPGTNSSMNIGTIVRLYEPATS